MRGWRQRQQMASSYDSVRRRGIATVPPVSFIGAGAEPTGTSVAAGQMPPGPSSKKESRPICGT